MTDEQRAAKFAKYDRYHVHHIDLNRLELAGGGDFYDRDRDQLDLVPDTETQEEAKTIAADCGMILDDAGSGRWEGWSEYTPDPGDISTFNWHVDPEAP